MAHEDVMTLALGSVRRSNSRRERLKQGVLIIVVTLGAACAWGAPAPTEYFAALPTFAGLDLAPDGKRIAMLRVFNGRYHLNVVNVEDGTSELLLAGNRRRFRWCRFANDERILCATDRAGDARDRIRLQAVNVDGSGKLTLRPAALGEGTVGRMAFQGDVVSWLGDDPNHVLLAVQVDASSVNIVRVNIYSNAQEPLETGLPLLHSWHADGQGEVRVGSGLIGADFRWVGRPPGAEGFTQLPDARGQDLTPLGVLGVSANGAAFYSALRGSSGRIGVYELSVADGNITRQLLEDPRFDFTGNLAFASDGSLFAAFHTRDLPTVRLLDPGWQARMDAIREVVPDDVLLPVSWDRDGVRMVVRGLSAGQSSSYYFYDYETRDLLRLGGSHPHLGEHGNVRAVEYQARDGHSIPAYLTLPPGRSPRRLPAVIIPHDGPAARVSAEFDYLVQFLASRGYAVLQPNFRGSTGYGRQHLEAGLGQWGLKMQDDVVDGIDWLKSQGIVDSGRVCILGRGYGGYVALMASIRTPSKIRCAVSAGGISDLRAMLGNLRSFGFDRLNRSMILRGMRGWSRLDVNSPLYNAQRVDVPVLVMHGEADRVVPVNQSRRLARALAAAGKAYRYVEQPGADHALSVEAHRLQFLEEVEAFLAFYL
jgi:dienelactone hydrolase